MPEDPLFLWVFREKFFEVLDPRISLPAGRGAEGHFCGSPLARGSAPAILRGDAASRSGWLGFQGLFGAGLGGRGSGRASGFMVGMHSTH